MKEELFSAQDIAFMKQALALAKKGKGTTSPNPMVGALLVRDNEIVGRGYHRKAGEPHAEVIAIRDAGDRARGSTLYVSLEPCCHQGKTPPCTEAIISKQIARVVVAMEDPNQLVNGKGISRLRSQGIKVTTGVCEADAKELNRVFIKHITTGLPYITIKAAATLDGKIATASGSSRWVTGGDARRYVHLLRYENDAVMAGINTVIVDDPLLTCRLSNRNKKSVKRIVADSHGRIPLSARVLCNTGMDGTIVAVTESVSDERRRLIEDTGAIVIAIREKEGRVDLDELSKALGKMGITSILVEGGGSLNASFVRQGLADRLVLFLAPKIIGGENALSFIRESVLKNQDTELMDDAVRLRLSGVKRFGEDIMLDYQFIKQG